MSNVSLTSTADARGTLNTMRTYREELESMRGSIGASMYRLEVASRNLVIQREMYRAADERLTGADIAVEAARLASSQILQQQGIALLTQANQQPAVALSLLN